MKKIISISLSDKLIKRIDKNRGLVNRSAYIEKQLLQLVPE